MPHLTVDFITVRMSSQFHDHVNGIHIHRQDIVLSNWRSRGMVTSFVLVDRDGVRWLALPEVQTRGTISVSVFVT